jgi:hypothetical protein
VKQHATLDFSDPAQSPSGDRSTRSLEGNAQAPWLKITANLRPSISWQEDETLQEGATSIKCKEKAEATDSYRRLGGQAEMQPG